MEDGFSGQVIGNVDDQNGRIPSMGEIGLHNFAPYMMNRIMARWNANLAEDLKARDITTVKMRTLAVLNVSASLTINELSVLAVTEQSTMSRTVDSLEEQGLIRRTTRSDDMRVRDVSITEEGRAIFEDLWPIMYGDLRRMFKDIEDDEYRAFVTTLHKILRSIRKHDI
ncbi:MULTISPECIES: MarR family winged helix-turn-helix transcriptional regulator [unclassified Rhizobium]|uniref:MarR family winged helix-turn-helix transcriptional regulator n=1 Tax=unclassified Rhizobium TaxID=2613769 RepID=UPI00177F93FF|nr:MULTISPECIES: MarR family transcriptional regulator [unclassified Rhizobium]MBD8688736.1 MarR family transcriptional regulator [Rhizobium sp. CFBP 13644]MBD8694119.1 MarR family transcriptional regulator [Rhizobium sp. CFBP 13717]